MDVIALGSQWLLHIRISDGRHRPRISMADPDYELCFVVLCLILWFPNLAFICFAYAGVIKKYRYLNSKHWRRCFPLRCQERQRRR